MASISASSLSTVLFAASNSSNLSYRPQLSFPSKLLIAKPSRISSSKVIAAPEVLEDSEGEAPTTKLSIVADSDKVAPKQQIRIKLRSYWVPLIEDSCKQIMDAAWTTNAKTMGPLPTKKRVYCVL